MRVIAIDGPAGSGKSTVAQRLASRLGLDYLDTGAMYRGVTFAALRRGIDPADAEDVAAMARRLELDVGDVVMVDGVDATIEIRGRRSPGRSASWRPTPRSGPSWSSGNGTGPRNEAEA